MPNVSLTRDLSTEDKAIARRRKLAESLYNQGIQALPNNEMAGGYVVRRSPLEGINKIAQVMLGVRGMKQAEEEEKALGDERNQRMAKALGDFQRHAQGAPEQTRVLNEGGEEQTTPAVQPNRQAAIESLMNSGVPEFQQTGFQTQLNEFQQQPMLQAQMAEREAARAQRMQELEMRASDQRLAAQDRAALQREMMQMRIDAQTDMQQVKGSSPYFTPVQTADGVISFDTRSGRAAPITIGDKTIIGSQSDPTLQGKIAGAKASAKELGEAQAKSQTGLSKVIDNADNMIKQIDDLIAHSGFESSVGATLKPGFKYVPGTKEADFNARLDQIKGGAFLQAFETLKGGGTITEVEGMQATKAITRMQTSQSEAEFKKAATEFRGIIQEVVKRAKGSAGAGAAPATAKDRIKFLGFE